MKEAAAWQRNLTDTEYFIHLGPVIFPTLIAVCYGIYLVVLEGFWKSNGTVLALLGLLTLYLPPAYKRSVFLFIPAYLLGGYMFGVIGCMALALGIAEGSGWGSIGFALFWIVLGGMLLWGVRELRGK
jgi:hypothetical protein